jgi:arylsulfatase A-like enzyme
LNREVTERTEARYDKVHPLGEPRTATRWDRGQYNAKLHTAEAPPTMYQFASVISASAISFLLMLPGYCVAAPPNVVMFLIDDLGATDLGCFGSTFYETPNIDRLAASGMRFTHAYAACPVCSPTRASIMTGRYPARTGVTDYIGAKLPPDWDRNTRLLPAPYSKQLSLEERTVAEALQDAGYATFHGGKWHLGNQGFLPTDQGFDVNIGGDQKGSPRSYFSPYRNAFMKDGPTGEHMPIRLANEATAFIAAHSDRPFFVYMPFYSVHIPLNAPKELIKKYETKAAGLKPAGAEVGREGDSAVRLVQNHPTYAAVVESMDTAVGMVLDKLKELDLEDNTLIIFTSDNGGLATAEGRPTSNLPLRAGKGWLYEGGIRVPTIVRLPGVTAKGSTCEAPIVSTDYFPTILEVTGRPLEPEHHVDGLSIAPLLRGKTRPMRPLFWHYPHYGNQGGRPGGAVRDDRYKLIEWYEGDEPELFDLQADPSEKTNIATDRPEVVERMKKLLDDWRADAGAKMPTKNQNFSADRVKNGAVRGKRAAG